LTSLACEGLKAPCRRKLADSGAWRASISRGRRCQAPCLLRSWTASRSFDCWSLTLPGPRCREPSVPPIYNGRRFGTCTWKPLFSLAHCPMSCISVTLDTSISATRCCLARCHPIWTTHCSNPSISTTRRFLARCQAAWATSLGSTSLRRLFQGRCQTACQASGFSKQVPPRSRGRSLTSR